MHRSFKGSGSAPTGRWPQHVALMALFLALCGVGSPVIGAERIFDFGAAPAQGLPPGFKPYLAGKGKPPEWKILLDDAPSAMKALTPGGSTGSKQPVLAQISRDPTDERFPLLVFEGEEFGDFSFTTRFKVVDGVMEQMAGVAFRFQDERNFYVARVSVPGRNISFYKFVNGIRGNPVGISAPLSAGEWHELGVQCVGNKIRIQLDGKEAMPQLTDNSLTKGRIGFFTKSDSVSYFADSKVVYTPLEILARKLVRSVMQEYPRLLGMRLYGVPKGGGPLQVLASSDPKEDGQLATQVEKDVVQRGVPYSGKEVGAVLVTLPVRDRNGETAAVLRLRMKSFPGQTEVNLMGRASPILRFIEPQVQNAKDLVD